MPELSSTLDEQKLSDSQKLRKASGMLDLVHKAKGTVLAPREVLKKIEVLSPVAVDVIEELLKGAKNESVRLRAAVEILGLAGISQETRISIRTDLKDMEDTDIDKRLQMLLGPAAQKYIEGEYTVVQEAEKEATYEDTENSNESSL